MIVRLVADIQNRLFWRIDTGRAALSTAFPLRDGTRVRTRVGPADGFTDRRPQRSDFGKRLDGSENAHVFGMIKLTERGSEDASSLLT